MLVGGSKRDAATPPSGAWGSDNPRVGGSNPSSATENRPVATLLAAGLFFTRRGTFLAFLGVKKGLFLGPRQKSPASDFRSPASKIVSLVPQQDSVTPRGPVARATFLGSTGKNSSSPMRSLKTLCLPPLAPLLYIAVGDDRSSSSKMASWQLALRHSSYLSAGSKPCLQQQFHRVKKLLWKCPRIPRYNAAS